MTTKVGVAIPLFKDDKIKNMHSGRKRFATIGILAGLCGLLLLGNGCVRTASSIVVNDVPPPENRILKPYTTPAMTADDAGALKGLIASATDVSESDRTDAWVVPNGIDPQQLPTGVSFQGGQALFAFVQQPNSSNPLWWAGGDSVFGKNGGYDAIPVKFAGVLFSSDAGRMWRSVFSIPPRVSSFEDGQITRFNPVGMFIEKKRLWLDIVDDAGGGSGEGTLVRYSSPDGVTWTRSETCYYYIPEKYFDVSKLPETYTHLGTVPDFPHGLRPYSTIDSAHAKCPDYVSKLP